jgi:hypothetical protein
MGLEKCCITWMKGSSPSTKAPINETIQTLVCHEPHAQKFTPLHFTCTHGLDGFSLGNTLDLGMIDPIGCLETPPTPKFDKLYNILEHFSSLKRGFDAHVWWFDY